MGKFTISCSRVGGVATLDMAMEPSSKVVEVAEILSMSDKFEDVQIIMHARIRMRFEKGVRVSSSPEAPYSGMSEQEMHDWNFCGQVTD